MLQHKLQPYLQEIKKSSYMKFRQHLLTCPPENGKKLYAAGQKIPHQTNHTKEPKSKISTTQNKLHTHRTVNFGGLKTGLPTGKQAVTTKNQV
jgi:hypothetical protein